MSAMLALADFVVATADSFNMIGEAAATGRPILVFEPSGGHPEARRFHGGPESPWNCACLSRAGLKDSPTNP